MSESKVDAALKELVENTKGERTMRGWVLKLLEGVRAVSIYEMGKVDGGRKKKRRTEVEYDAMAMDAGNGENGGGERARGPSPDLGGMAEMFG
jgi:exportin-5